MPPLATISIVSCHSVGLVQWCLESIGYHGVPIGESPGRAALILTSNGNERVADYFRNGVISDHIAVINQVNVGFIAANRQALAICETPFFITLNDDVTIEDPDWLEKMTAPFRDDKVAAVGVEGFPCELATPGVFRGSPGPRVDYVEMSCAAFRTDALREVDAFPAWLTGSYGEDVHAGIALKRAGYKLVQVPVSVKHEGGVTAKTIPDIREQQTRNHAALMERYGDFWVEKDLCTTLKP